MLHRTPRSAAFVGALLLASTPLAGCQSARSLDVVNDCSGEIWVSVNESGNPFNDDDNLRRLDVGDVLGLAIGADHPIVRIGRGVIAEERDIFSVIYLDFETETNLAVVTLGGDACEPIHPG